jgi:bifunctional NMN adenylyltransferase/nudix hydrolase
MSKKYDTLVFIARLQPIHNAHVTIIKMAMAMARQVIVIVGSAHQARTFKNPFTSHERECMIIDALRDTEEEFDCSLRIEHNIDTIYNDQAWMIRVQQLVGKHTLGMTKIGLIGHDKDESSFYLKWFPTWAREEVELLEPLNATNIRDLYFRRDVNLKFLERVVPASTLNTLANFMTTPAFEQIVREREFIAQYRKQYESLPYPPIFVTADAVVIQNGHVLMIKRRSEPGRGLWALPGGFVNARSDRSVEDAAIRELREETGIKVPVPVLRGSIVRSRVFDAVERSARGRTITHAYFIVLTGEELPRVKGADDALRAKWVPIAEVKSDECFEDHFEIISHFVGA